MSDNAFSWVLSVITNAWNWLGTYNYHGVTLSAYILGLIILGMLIRRIFN